MSSEVSLSNAVLGAWESAMDSFFERVERAQVKRGMSNEQVEAELEKGYGDAVSDAWAEWVQS